MQLNSYYPEPKQFPNYVPEEFVPFMDKQVEEWVNNGAQQPWKEAKKDGDPDIPTVISFQALSHPNRELYGMADISMNSVDIYAFFYGQWC